MYKHYNSFAKRYYHFLEIVELKKEFSTSCANSILKFHEQLNHANASEYVVAGHS